MSDSFSERRQRLAYLDGRTETPTREKQQRLEDLEAAFEEIQKEKPGLLLANELLADYKRAKNEHEKKEACRRVIRALFQHAHTLESFFDRLNFLETFLPEDQPLIEDIKQDIDSLSKETIDKEQLNIGPEKQAVMDRWIELYAKSEWYKPLVEKYLRLSFEAVHNDENYLRRLYPIAYTVCTASNFQIFRTALDILLRETPILDGSVEEIDRYTAGLITLNDDILKMTLDIDAVTDFFGKLYGGDSYRHFREKTNYLSERLGNQSRFAKYANQHSLNPKFQKILRFHDGVNQGPEEKIHTEEINLEKSSQKRHPYPLFMDPRQITPLRRAFNEKMAQELTERQGKKMLPVYKPNHGEAIFVIPSDDAIRKKMITEWFLEPQETERTTTPKVFESVALLFPNLLHEQEQNIRKRVEDLIHELRTQLKYLVSPRGDAIHINDPFLNDLGITSVTFRPQTSVLDLQVTIRVGNVDCVCKLDNYYMLREAETNEPLKLTFSASTLISELVLSQLRTLLCEKVEHGKKTNNGETGETEAEKKMIRRAHIRRLPPGQKFSEEQAHLALTRYKVDLVRMNADLGLRPEEGQYTLVREVEHMVEDPTNQEPVHSFFTQASQLGELCQSPKTQESH